MKDLTQGREIKTILLFSLPILVGNLFQQLYNISDTIIVGNFLGKECLAAVGFSFQIHFLLISLSTGISIGTSILISRYFGEKDMESVKKVMDTGFVFCLFLGFIIALLGVCFSYQILLTFRVPSDLLESANIYLKIMFIGVIPTFAYNALTNILRGIGDSKAPTCILIAAALLNIILDILFIKAFNMGVAGAAIATVFAQMMSFVVCMAYMKKCYSTLFINMFHLQFDRVELKQSLRIGTPAMIQQVFVSIGFMSLQFLINGFGTDCMAAYTAASKVDAFAEMPALNLGQAMTNFTAQNLGAKRKDRVLKGGKYALIIGMAISACISVIIVIFPSVFISIFNRDVSVVNIGNSYLRIVPAFYIVFAAMQILNGLLLGYGRSFVPMIASVCSLCCLQVPMAVILSSTELGYNGIWLAAPIGWFGGLLIRAVYYLRIRKKANL